MDLNLFLEFIFLLGVQFYVCTFVELYLGLLLFLIGGVMFLYNSSIILRLIYLSLHLLQEISWWRDCVLNNNCFIWSILCFYDNYSVSIAYINNYVYYCWLKVVAFEVIILTTISQVKFPSSMNSIHRVTSQHE